MRVKTQGFEKNYELHTLGWKAFQDLCNTIMGEIFGQAHIVFVPFKDGGRDGAFNGEWQKSKKVRLEGSFVVQCKYSSSPDKSLTLSILRDEFQKAQLLAKKGLADNYIVITNMKVTGPNEELIREKFLSVKGINKCLVFGNTWVEQQLNESPRLRMLVPRVYGIGDLSQILDERAYAQAAEIVSIFQEDLSKFVVTKSHRQSADALIDKGFVLLLGEPASGKTTIATCLSLGAVDSWNCNVLKLRSADEFVRHWNPHESKQFFWFDDVFGATQYQNDLATSWNQAIPHLAAAIRKGAKVVMTSRDYIFRAAMNDLKTEAFPLFNDSQVVINVQELTKVEKEGILYNHIKLGDQSLYFKKKVKPFLSDVVKSNRFLPEIARRLGNEIFTKELSCEEKSVKEFVEKPVEFLKSTIRNLDKSSKAATAFLYIGGGWQPSPINLTPRDREILNILGVSPAEVRESLTALNGSIVQRKTEGGKARWVYKHPTIHDAYGSYVAEDPEMLEVYLEGVKTQDLLREIVCGDMNLPGVKIVIGSEKYDYIIQKLNAYAGPIEDIMRFLAYRCADDFLRIYFHNAKNNSKNLINIGSYVFAHTEVDLLIRYENIGLLSAETKKDFINIVADLAVETPDADFFIYDSLRSIISEKELEYIKSEIRTRLIGSLVDVVRNWDLNYYDHDDPEDYYYPLTEALNSFVGLFEGEDAIVDKLVHALADIKKDIDYRKEMVDENDDENYEGYGEPQSSEEETEEKRSIFDDVDE